MTLQPLQPPPPTPPRPSSICTQEHERCSRMGDRIWWWSPTDRGRSLSLFWFSPSLLSGNFQRLLRRRSRDASRCQCHSAPDGELPCPSFRERARKSKDVAGCRNVRRSASVRVVRLRRPPSIVRSPYVRAFGDGGNGSNMVEADFNGRKAVARFLSVCLHVLFHGRRSTFTIGVQYKVPRYT